MTLVIWSFGKANRPFGKARGARGRNYPEVGVQQNTTNMAFQHGQLSIASDPRSPNPSQDRIYVHYKKRMTRIMTSEIRYVEAHRAYCLLTMRDGQEFTLSLSLGSLERQLPPSNLLRIHRSYLVNVLYVDQVAEDFLLTGKKQLPVSRSCRPALLGSIRTIGK